VAFKQKKKQKIIMSTFNIKLLLKQQSDNNECRVNFGLGISRIMTWTDN